MSAWLDPATLSSLANGVLITVALTVITGTLGSVIGVTIGTMRMSGSRAVRLGAGAFVEVFRNIPALIQVIFWAFAFPSLFGPDTRSALFFDNWLWNALGPLTGIPIPYYAVAASAGLVLNTGAHLAEIFRAGAGSVPNNEVETATMLGAGRWSVLSSIVIPGALRSSFPAITTRLIHNLKNTALVSFVAVPDLFHAMQGAITQSFRATELLTLTALSYLVLSAGLAWLLGLADVRLHRGRDSRGAI